LKGKAILEFTAQHFANLFSFCLLLQVVAGRDGWGERQVGVGEWLVRARGRL